MALEQEGLAITISCKGSVSDVVWVPDCTRETDVHSSLSCSIIAPLWSGGVCAGREESTSLKGVDTARVWISGPLLQKLGICLFPQWGVMVLEQWSPRSHLALALDPESPTPPPTNMLGASNPGDSWWWTGKPGVLPSMGSQRVGHDWVTGLNWTALNPSDRYDLCSCKMQFSHQSFRVHAAWIGMLQHKDTLSSPQ